MRQMLRRVLMHPTPQLDQDHQEFHQFRLVQLDPLYLEFHLVRLYQEVLEKIELVTSVYLYIVPVLHHLGYIKGMFYLVARQDLEHRLRHLCHRFRPFRFVQEYLVGLCIIKIIIQSIFYARNSNTKKVKKSFTCWTRWTGHSISSILTVLSRNTGGPLIRNSFRIIKR